MDGVTEDLPTQGSLRIGALRGAPLPVFLERPRLTALLEASGHQVLLMCAPLGSGKTTAARHFLARRPGSATYLRLSSSTSVSNLEQMLAEVASATEVVVDDLDAAPAPVVDTLVERFQAGADSRRFILLGRSRRRMRVHRLLALGVAGLMDASTLAFTPDEVAELANAMGAACDDDMIVQLTHDTDGWATPLAWIIRDATAAARSLRVAVECWMEDHAHLLLDLLGTEYATDSDAFNAFKVRLREGAAQAQRELEEFEALGFPVLRTRRSFRPHRLLLRLLHPKSVAKTTRAASGVPRMTLGAFARFHCEIGGRAVAFARRRERNIFAYVALAADGRATRKQLIEAFWPSADRAVAAQNLRTAISHIRLAIGRIVGAESVGAYFRSEDDLCVDFENVAFDVRRFTEHLRHGDVEAAQGAIDAAERHYSAADHLYRGRILSAEALEPCFHSVADDLERLYGEMLVGRVQMHVAAGDMVRARTCANRVLERTQDAAFRLRAIAFLDGKTYAETA